MAEKALKFCLILVILLSVLFPTGAYFCAVAVFIAAIAARRSRQMLAELASDRAIFIMLFCIVLSVLYSQEKLSSLGGLVMVGLNAGLYLVLVTELSKAGVGRYYKLLNMCCVLICIYGIYQFVSGNLIIQKCWVDEKTFGRITRIYSTMYNPNIFASYLAINLSFGLARFKAFRSDILLSVNLLLSSICLLLTYSRGGFIAFLTAAFVLYFLKGRSRRVAIYIVIMSMLFAIMNSSGPASRIDPSVISRDSSSLYRVEIWKAAFGLFLERPVFGHGIGTAWYFLSGSTDKLHGYILHCHNIYLQVAVEMGLTGACAFVCLIGRKISVGVRLMREGATEEEAAVIRGFIACAAGIAVHGLIDAVIFVPGLSLAFIGYAAMYGKVTSAPATSFDGEGVFKLFGGKGADNEKYQDEEGEACQA